MQAALGAKQACRTGSCEASAVKSKPCETPCTLASAAGHITRCLCTQWHDKAHHGMVFMQPSVRCLVVDMISVAKSVHATNVLGLWVRWVRVSEGSRIYSSMCAFVTADQSMNRTVSRIQKPRQNLPVRARGQVASTSEAVIFRPVMVG
jgi:hypothetical protein